MKASKSVAAALLEASEIAIASHIAPDGDCLGSMLALALVLRAKGKKVFTLNADPVPDMFRFLPGQEDIITPKQISKIPPLLVLVDSSHWERIGAGFEQWPQKTKMIINIDHHVSNTFYGHLNLVDSKAAATAELVYVILEKMPAKITPQVATCLYTALVTDTGSFQYENCTATTLRMAAKLVEQGADVSLIREYLWEKQPLNSIRLLAASLATLSLAYSGQVAWMSVTEEMLNNYKLSPEHAEGLVNYPRSIDGVEVSIFFRELPEGLVKVNLRSKKTVDVNKIAQIFDGGGHRRAAGCIIKGKIDEVIAKVVHATGKRL